MQLQSSNINNPIHWGILSSAAIGRKNCIAINETSHGQVTAISSRSLSTAQHSAQQRGIEKAYGSHAELINDPTITAVYNPLPTNLRCALTLQLIQHGKHCLHEKPAAANVKELNQLIDEAMKQPVLLMDGVMFMHHPRLQQICEHINLPSFGRVQHVFSSFCFPLIQHSLTDIRLQTQLERFGCLGDLGWYTIRLSLIAFQWEMPVAVSCHCVELNGAVVDAVATLFYSAGRSAQFHASFQSAFEQRAVISGDKRSLALNDFVIPSNEHTAYFDVSSSCGLFDLDRRADASGMRVRVETEKTQECRMFEEFNRIIQMNDKQEIQRQTEKWGRYTLQTQIILEACLQSAQQNARVNIEASAVVLRQHH